MGNPNSIKIQDSQLYVPNENIQTVQQQPHFEKKQSQAVVRMEEFTEEVDQQPPKGEVNSDSNLLSLLDDYSLEQLLVIPTPQQQHHLVENCVQTSSSHQPQGFSIDEYQETSTLNVDTTSCSHLQLFMLDTMNACDQAQHVSHQPTDMISTDQNSILHTNRANVDAHVKEEKKRKHKTKES